MRPCRPRRLDADHPWLQISIKLSKEIHRHQESKVQVADAVEPGECFVSTARTKQFRVGQLAGHRARNPLTP